MKQNRFLISGGGTGGHIYPAISIAEELSTRFENNKILFVGSSDRMVIAMGLLVPTVPVSLRF